MLFLNCRLRGLACFLLGMTVFFTPSLFGMEVTKAEDALDAYLQLSTYCDKGVHTAPFPSSFERCINNEKMFKSTSQGAAGDRHIWWSDGLTAFHLYSNAMPRGGEKTNSYTEQPLKHLLTAPDGREMLVQYLLWELIGNNNSIDGTRRYLRTFAMNPALSDANMVVFDRERFNNVDEKNQVIERLTISRRDGFIRKFETISQGKLFSSLEVTEVIPDRALSKQDFEHDVSLLTQYWSFNHPGVSLSVAALFTLLCGYLFWVAMTRWKSGEFVTHLKRRLWRYYGISLGIVVLGIGALAGLSMVGGGGGHPAPIIYVGILGAICALAFIYLAIFLLCSHLVPTMSEGDQGEA